ncbi:MAG: hypothetical protein N3G19_00595 [Candidatus Pacearchaeota archaeon]|nr:hypothetical protein [Candidatus Pacearchaeota archaeon]
MKKSWFKKWFKSKAELIIFLISIIVALAFFLWQRRFFSWDFSVYMMNAEYILGYGNYFEWLRPPFVPLILMIFRPFGRFFAAYAFVIFAVCLYFFSLKLFHNKFLKNINNSEIFYLFAINPFVLGYGLGIGTELISLSLIIFFVVFAFSVTNNIFLSIAMLTRYSNIILFPLVFISKNIKKIIIGIIVIIMMLLPWFFLNYAFTGHAFTSIGDYYALNSLKQPPAQFNLSLLFSHLLLVVNICLPFLFLGFFKKEKKDKELIVILVSLVILTLFMYLINSIKEPRFLFNLFLPVCYFSIFGFNFIIGKIRNKKTIAIVRILLICFLLFSSFSAFVFAENASKGFIREEKMIKQIITKLDNCTVASDLWVYFNWYGKKAISAPMALNLIETNEPEIFSMIDKGYNIILFKNSEAFAKNKNFIEALKSYLIANNEDYILLRDPNKCKMDDKINRTYMDFLKPFGEFSEDFGGCDALLLRLKLRKICKIFEFL